MSGSAAHVDGREAEENSMKKPVKPAPKGAAKKSAETPAKRATKGTPAPAAPQVVEMIRVDQIRPDPTQPRKTFDTSDIEGTLEVVDGQAVEGRGIVHPLIVQKIGGKTPYELFDGERRWRSARAKGLLEVPCLVQVIPDERVLEKQIALGVAQKGLLPFELADALSYLQSKTKKKGLRKLSADELALRVGLPSGRMVHRYLALAGLCPEARQAFDEGKISLAVALELATVSNPHLQASAVADVRERDIRTAKHLIHDRFHLRLAAESCGFDPADPTLPGGACASCPKSSASQRSLWVDSDETDDRCTDVECFETKKAETWNRRKASAEAAGAKIVEGAAAKELYPNGWDTNPQRNDLIDLDDDCPFDLVAFNPPEEATTDDEEKRPARTWRELLGVEARPEILAQDQRGKAHDLITYDQAADQLARAGRAVMAEEVKKAAALTSSTGEAGDVAPLPLSAHQRHRAACNAAGVEALGQILAEVELEEPINVWRFLAQSLCRQEAEYQDDDALEDHAEKRGFKRPEGDERDTWACDALLGWLDSPGLSLSEARDLVIELVICREGFPAASLKKSEFIAAARRFGVDYTALVNGRLVAAGLEAVVVEEEVATPPAPAPLGPIDRPCPRCKATVGTSCSGRGVGPGKFHKERLAGEA
jgi:ParB/RepB/Spo0J family partition protein